MSPKDRQPQDIESELIQKMSELLEKKEEKSFFSQLFNSAPSIFITVVGIAVTFYIYVNVELSKIQQNSIFQDRHAAELVKIIAELREDIKGLERRLYSLELKSAQPK